MPYAPCRRERQQHYRRPQTQTQRDGSMRQRVQIFKVERRNLLPIMARPTPATVPPLRKRPRIDVLRIASETLRGFDRETMKYKGTTITLTEVMRLTNQCRKAKALPQIDFNKQWVVP